MPKAKKLADPVPTKEELEAREQADLAELEKLDAEVETGAESKQKDVAEVVESQNEEEVTEDETETEAEEVEEKVEKKEIDHKKRFIESSQEARVLHSKVKGFEEASKVKDPTEEDMKKEYGDSWEDMSDFEQKIAKNDLKNTWRNEALDKVVAESKNVDEWNQKVDDYTEDPQTLIDNPDLEGKVDDFRIFVTKPSRRGVDFDDLVKAFLFDVMEKRPAKSKGKMMETGTGGPSDKSKKKSKLTIEQGVALKDSNYEEYKRQLMAGNIEDDF